MFPNLGFVDGVNHSSAMLQTLGNSYAAMPSLHAADALIVGFFLVSASRSIWAKVLWALWPVWVWFCVIATGERLRPRRARRNRAGGCRPARHGLGAAAPRTPSRGRPGHRNLVIVRHSRIAMLEMNSTSLRRVKDGYTTGARSLASRSGTRLARTGATPNILTTTGVSLCRARPFSSRSKTEATRCSSTGSPPRSS